jgi:hypothetical protein
MSGSSLAACPRQAARGQGAYYRRAYLETKEHVVGFWILEAADMNEALEWGLKGVVAFRAPVEVRPFFRSNVPSK